MAKDHDVASLTSILRVFDEAPFQEMVSAISRLKLLGTKRLTKRLIAMLRYSPSGFSFEVDWVVARRAAIVSALGTVGDRRAKPILIQLLQNVSEPIVVRDRAAEALAFFVGRGSRAAIKALSRALFDPSVDVRWSAAWALGSSRDRLVTYTLMQLQDDKQFPRGNTSVSDVARESVARILGQTPNGRQR